MFPAMEGAETEKNMTYENICRAVFLERPNRFIARVEREGKTETVHVKNTGRCRELLIPGSEVWLTRSGNPARKTKYDLIAWDEIRPEYTYGASRVDFFMRRGSEKTLMEVKGCTLERNGTGFFPDAPTERGAKHLRELMHAAAEGYHAILAFVIQMDGVYEVRPNRETDPAFADALEEAVRHGVDILFLPCHVEPDSLTIISDGFPG